MGDPLIFNPFKGDPQIPHGSEEVYSLLFVGCNIAMGILHSPSILGFRPYKFNKDLVKGFSEEASVLKRVKEGMPPVWPYRKPKLDADSVPAMWWNEAHSRSWKVERQGAASDQI